MNFVADEGVDRQIVSRLREARHDVIYIAELEPGIDDSQVLAKARAEGALLITADKDFGELVYRRSELSAGVLLVRLAGLTPQRRADLVVSCVENHGSEMVNAFCVLSAGSFRLRRQLDL